MTYCYKIQLTNSWYCHPGGRKQPLLTLYTLSSLMVKS
jgi:hypothetical protein